MPTPASPLALRGLAPGAGPATAARRPGPARPAGGRRTDILQAYDQGRGPGIPWCDGRGLQRMVAAWSRTTTPRPAERGRDRHGRLAGRRPGGGPPALAPGLRPRRRLLPGAGMRPTPSSGRSSPRAGPRSPSAPTSPTSSMSSGCSRRRRRRSAVSTSWCTPPAGPSSARSAVTTSTASTSSSGRTCGARSSSTDRPCDSSATAGRSSTCPARPWARPCRPTPHLPRAGGGGGDGAGARPRAPWAGHHGQRRAPGPTGRRLATAMSVVALLVSGDGRSLNGRVIQVDEGTT